jgi:hypothetical protein
MGFLAGYGHRMTLWLKSLIILSLRWLFDKEGMVEKGFFPKGILEDGWGCRSKRCSIPTRASVVLAGRPLFPTCGASEAEQLDSLQ